jgi:hypothetical protein
MLSLLMLQSALAPGVGDAHARSRLPARLDLYGFAIPEEESMPYLQVIGSTPLRFGAPPPPPDLSGKPAAGAPPKPAVSSEPVRPPDLAVPSATTVVSAKASPVEVPAAEAAAATPPETAAPPPSPVKRDRSPLSILPDDMPSAPRAEDFLPFFQFPGGGKSTGARSPARAPSPDQLPPSSATYEQK